MWENICLFSLIIILIKIQNIKNLIKDENKYIIYGELEALKKNLSEFYDEEQERFCYIEKYIKDYIDNNTNGVNILNDLMNNSLHPKLNYISYYKGYGNIYDIYEIENDLKKKTAAKYLISILKTNFINRLITKGKNNDLVHYILFTNDAIYIYPPDAYYNTILYSLFNSTHNLGESDKSFSSNSSSKGIDMHSTK